MEYMEFRPEFVKQHTMRSGEIVIEIDNEHVTYRKDYDTLNYKVRKTPTTLGNRQQHFPPVDTRSEEGRQPVNYVRSRKVLVRDGLPTRFAMEPALQPVVYIPGERIHFDPVRKVGRITDALFDKENERLLDELTDVFRNVGGHSRSTMLLPGIYHEVDLKDPCAYWGWAYAMRRIMDGDSEHRSGPDRHRGCAADGPRLCRPIQNVEQMPTLAECVASLKVKIPCARFSSVEAQKDWENTRKEEDPNYVRQDGFEIVLTPYLAGTLVAAEE